MSYRSDLEKELNNRLKKSAAEYGVSPAELLLRAVSVLEETSEPLPKIPAYMADGGGNTGGSAPAQKALTH